jgi:environmental stress-induced protein Ves
MKLSLLRPSDFQRSPWKNGLGWTDQIAISPKDADLRRGNFDWRVSTAHIAQSAPFSPFPEHDRVLVIIDGAGVRLSHSYEEGEAPEVVDLPPGEPYEFPGDVPTRCELVDGPIRDFSVFIRKGIVTAMVETMELGDSSSPFEWEPQGSTGFVFVISGSVLSGQTAVNAGELLRIDQEPNAIPEPLRLTSPSARLLLLQLDAGR